jgi:hypothetical protein
LREATFRLCGCPQELKRLRQIVSELPTTQDLAVRRAGRPELPLSEVPCLLQLATRVSVRFT